MKKILFIFLCCFSLASFGQQLDCKKFKIGNFKVIDTEYSNLLIERTKDKVIWYDEKSKLKTESEIKWLSNCSYTIQNTKVLQNPNAIEFYESSSIDTTKIIETRPNSYIELLTNNTFGITFQREVFKAN